jgi:phosphate uptake regulator
VVGVESRKIQRVGYSTLTVSLPSNWAKNMGLKPGDVVNLLPESDGSLKLVPNVLAEHKEETNEFTINSDLCNEQGMLERIIVGNYILGRDVLIIMSSKRIRSIHVEEVRRILHSLIGLGIVEETPRKIVLQCSIDPVKFQIDMLMRRLCVIASTIHTEAAEALVKFDPELAKDAISREDEADMMYWLAMRLLLSAQRIRSTAKKIGLEDPLQVLYIGLVLGYLELIADHATNIARNVVELQKYKDKISRRVIERISNISELTHTVFQKAVKCFFTGDMEIANSVLEMRKAIKAEEETLMKELPEVPHLRCITIGLTRIADSGADIAVIAINRALEKSNKMCSAHCKEV